VVLEEKGEAADFDARRKAEREVRWAVAEEDAFEEEKSNLHHTKQSAEDFTVFAAPSPPTVSRHSADARPVRGLAKADASALATAAALRAKRLRHKKHVPTPPSAKWDFGVEPGMVGDTLAVWDLCSRYADFWRLPPFPFARLAAALCPDRRGDNFGSTDFGATTPGGHLPVSTPGKVRGDSLLPNGKTPVATTVWAMSPMGPPDTSKTSIGVPTAFSTAVGAEWLDAQPGDAELASECLLRDVHCAFLRVIDNTDVELQQAPVRSSAEGGGGALPVGWPERVRVLIEARPAAHVKDAAFGAARALRKKELTACPPKAKLALLQCLASLAVDSPAFGAHAKHVKDVRDACGNPDLIGIDSTGSKYWRLGANAGIGAVFVEKPGFEKNELNEPAVGGGTARENFDSLAAQNMANDDDVAHTPDTSLKTAAPGAESRVSSRVRHKPVKFEDTSMVDAKAASCAKAEKEKESSTRTPKKATETQTKWCWYPASAFTALAEWLRDSGDAGDETLAEALLTPPEVPEDLVFGGAKNDDDDDDDDAMDADDDAGELDVVELTAAVASALAQRKRGGGTALDGYVGLDRPLTRGVSPDGPRALVALRVNLTVRVFLYFPNQAAHCFTSNAGDCCPHGAIHKTLTTFRVTIIANPVRVPVLGRRTVGWRTPRRCCHQTLPRVPLRSPGGTRAYPVLVRGSRARRTRHGTAVPHLKRAHPVVAVETASLAFVRGLRANHPRARDLSALATRARSEETHRPGEDVARSVSARRACSKHRRAAERAHAKRAVSSANSRARRFEPVGFEKRTRLAFQKARGNRHTRSALKPGRTDRTAKPPRAHEVQGGVRGVPQRRRERRDARAEDPARLVPPDPD
jgi:hypothetical protein